MRKIKILHIIKSLGRGGAEMLLPETLKIHDKEKFEFHYIYFLPWKDQMVTEIESQGGKVVCLSAKNNLSLLAKANKIKEYCIENNIQLIHCHLPWAGFSGRIAHQLSGIPMLYTEHNMQERYHIATKLLNKITFNSQTLAFGVSDDVVDSINKNIRPKIPVKTLLNGVNTDNFIRTDNKEIRKLYNIPENALVIGNIAVFRFQKRLKEWLQVFNQIHKLNSNVYGIIVGAGPLEEEIKSELSELKLESKVFFPGLQKDVKKFLEAFDIFMMSSSFEGLPIALLEAMSMECAIVATDAGGIKEVIRNERDGLICKTEDWGNLNILVQKLIDNPNMLIDMKTAARRRVLEKFSLKRMVGELEEYYIKYSL